MGRRSSARWFVLASIAAAFTLAACGAIARPLAQRPSPPSPGPVSISSLERGTVDAVNRERTRARLPALYVSAALTKVARAHSEFQARTGKSGHEGEGGTRPADRARAHGIDWKAIGENVAMNFGYEDPVATAVEGWMKSAPHRHNILDPDFEQTGVGVAVGKDGKIYLTQMFLDPPE